MAKVNVEVLNAVVDGKTKGTKFELDEKEAKQLEKGGFVKVVGKPEPKPKAAAAKPAPKQTAKAKKPATKDNKEAKK